MGRLIDADKLIEEMGEEPYVWTDSAEEIAERNQWLADMHIIESAPTIDAVSEWIPCSERLPKEEGRFLVTVQKEAWDRKYSDIEIAYCSPNHKWFNIANCDVLAWMPLPQPYKETDHE